MSPSLVRRLWRRQRAFGRSHRVVAFCICLFLCAWTWWDAQAGGYAGLPVNLLGQVIGDLLLMGLVAPVGNRRRAGQIGRPTGIRALVDALSQAKHRIQLLDLQICLAQFAPSAPDRPAFAGETCPGELARALGSALDNDVCVEILLPDPDAPSSDQAAWHLGLDPDHYRRSLRLLSADLATLPGRAHAGRLDLRLYAVPAAASIVRCDEQVWASLYQEGAPGTAVYLGLDRRSENARALQSYFNRLHATAHPMAYAIPYTEIGIS